MHQFECIHPYNACKQFDSGLLQKVGVLIVPSLREFRKAPENVSGNLIGVDLKGEVLRVSPWARN